MATVNAVVLKHHKKEDGTWNVKISVNHRSQARYIDTSSYVNKTYLDSKGKLKKTYIEKFFASRLSKYRDAISDLGAQITHMSCADLKEYLIRLGEGAKVIDLFDEIGLIIDGYKSEGKLNKASIYKVLLNHLKDFMKANVLNVADVTPAFLYAFEEFLRKDKTRIIVSPTGKKRIAVLEGIATNGIINYMDNLSNCISILERKYNNPMIQYTPVLNPFQYYKAPKPTKRQKRNLEVSRLVEIFQVEAFGFIENMSKDLFILSFYLNGMNPKDMYVYLTDPDLSGQLEYARSKVKAKRSDGGVTNVVIYEQVRWIIKKYSGVIQSRYSNNLYFNQALGRGWKAISERLGFKVTMYYARHSFGNIARKICKFSKDDVSFALNHKYGIDVTDVYVEPDWDVVHKVQAEVIKVVEDALDKYRKEVA